jgi:hypothetical protein
MKRDTATSGFIALISILIVSAVLLATTLGLAQFGLANRFFIMHLEQKAASKNLAEGCVQMARIQAYNDPSYTDSLKDVDIAEKTCTIHSVTNSGSATTIKARATEGESISNLCVVVNNTDGSFTSWKEVPKLTNTANSCP